MKVCLGQINTTPGDFAGNFTRIATGIERADAEGCQVVVFPELTIPGYLSQDLVYDPAYIDRNLAVLADIVELTRRCHADLHVVVGYIDRNPGVGKPFFNMAAVIAHGEVVCRYRKQLLPFYDVFDELRYYEPGEELAIIDICGYRTGIAICEDLWNDKGADGYRYEDNPLSLYRRQNVDIILSLNSSPYVHGKAKQRLSVIKPGLGTDISLVYVNQRGGQDELVFDGQSFVLSGGELVYQSNTLFEDSFDVVEVPAVDGTGRTVTVESVALFELLVLCLRDYVRKSGFRDVVLASSGGVDSAVVCKIACAALGAEHVHAIRMPSRYSSSHSLSDALQLHGNLGCWDYEVPVDHEPVLALLNSHYRSADVDDGIAPLLDASNYASVADENIQARLRDLYVMHFSNAFGAMPLSTGNKTESACGYYTHFDMNFSFAPIKDLYKFQVLAIAREQEDIPDNIWRKPPSAELAEGQTDEASLLPYAVLDPIVRAHVEDYISTFPGFLDWFGDMPPEQAISGDLLQLQTWVDSSGAADDFRRILSLIGRMEYKRRQTCPGTKVSKVAFGIGRRIPIVEKWS